MIRIDIEPIWRFRREEDGESMLVMLDFLNEIRATGKITSAAGRAHLSYRHCWNLIESGPRFSGHRWWSGSKGGARDLPR